MPARRQFLRILGGGVVLAAGGVGTFLATRTPTRALAPWGQAGQSADPRLAALSYAILAPNPHNRQPWLVELTGPDAVAIWRDLDRRLPQTDPFDRQLTIGMGCFLEVMAIAATQTGHGTQIDLFPEGESGPVARVRLIPGATPDPLFDHILARRTCKEPFDPRPVPPADALALGTDADIVTDPVRVADLIALTTQAWDIEALTPRTWAESIDLARLGRAQIEANPDGIDIGGPFVETLILLGQLSRQGQLDPKSYEFAQTVAMYHEMLAATPAYAVVQTPGNTRTDQIAAGRTWARLNLAATGRGLSLQPVSQCLQEYPEMAACRARAQHLLARPGHSVQMLGRLGHGPATPPSPRWPLESRMRHA